MSFISSIILVLTLSLSWNYIHDSSAIPESTHMSIQSDLRGIIQTWIAEQVPTASNIKIHRFWTETVNRDSVKAHFKYSYDDISEEGAISSRKVTLDGYAVVNRSTEQNDKIEYWNFEEFYLLNDQVEYTEPLKILSSANGN